MTKDFSVRVLADALYPLFFKPGEVVEVRAFGLRGKNKAWGNEWANGIVSGYFDEPARFVESAGGTDAAGADGVYFNPNPCKKDLLARANNRLVPIDNKKPLTSDKDIDCIRWLLIDLDPIRPTGISSSQDELNAAETTGRLLTEYLENELGFPRGIRALSGNGYHVCYRLPDLPNTPEISGRNGLIHRCLLSLSKRFTNDLVKIDEVVFNAARIWKLYGTWARKGDSTEDRPHRQSMLAKDSPETLDQVGIVSLELLEMLAVPLEEVQPTSSPHATVPAKKGKPGNTRTMETQLGPLQIRPYLEQHGRKILREKQQGAETMFCLEECVFDSSHRGGEAAIVSSPYPPFITYHCFHDSCEGRTWKEAKQLISGNETLAHFCEGYDPNWRPPANKKTDHGKQLAAMEYVPETIEMIEGNEAITHPLEVDPLDFFDDPDKKRPVFVVNKLFRYMMNYLWPIRYTAPFFWKYIGGVWKRLEVREVSKVASVSLEDYKQPARVNNVVEIMQMETNKEADSWQSTVDGYVNTKSGMLKIATGEVFPHAPEFYSQIQVPQEVDPQAQCPLWLKTLEEIFKDNPAKIRILQEYMGYCFMETCSYEKALFMFGSGANGKSTVLYVLEHLVGTENVVALSIEAISGQFALGGLRNKMVNIATEVESKDKVGTENLKKCISGDLLTTDQKYGQPVTFRTPAKFIFAMNSSPTITDKTFGFARKIMVLNFNRRFEEHERDKTLKYRLVETELSGIFNWCMGGARRLIEQKGFSSDKKVMKETERFLASMNPFLVFVGERCLKGEGLYVPTRDLYDEYKSWCAEGGSKAQSQIKFNEQVEAIPGVIKKRPRVEGGRRVSMFYGVGLVSVWGDCSGPWQKEDEDE